ncbi:hypothetical protein ACEPAF_8240 [Sanghuangporus sanghuang]
MAEPRSNMSIDNSNAVPLEAPPAYETPKPDDVDIEQRANDQREGPSARMMAFFSRYKQHWKKFALYFAVAVVSLWFTVVILNAFGVRRSGIVYSTSYSKEHRFRPAASPIITQTLDDGRTLIRGAQPTML